MNNRERLDYFVLMVKLVKSIYEAETRNEMARKGVPAKKISLKLNP